MRKRRISKAIYVGNVKVGGDAPVSVQSMTKTDTRDVAATVDQIRGLEEVGCQIIRCAVPDMEAARALAEIKKQISIPLVADIHFHYQLALEALKSGVDCLRLNPGNIRDRDKVELVVREAKARQVPIRIGVNFGSLPPVGGIGLTRGLSRHTDGVNKLPKAGEAKPGEYSVVDHMVQTGLWEIGILEDLDFDLIKISLKAFDIDTTVEAYRRMAQLVPYPLHLGITESGTAKAGSIRSAIGLGMLLYEGIGDTIRVSLSDDPREEVYTGIEILKSLELRKEGAVLVACPSCGRADVDVVKLANTVDQMLKKTKSPIKVAVMGCLPPEQEVFTEEGPVPIGQVQRGMRVLGPSGRYLEVAETMEHPYEGELVEVTPRGAPPFRLTPNHRVLALERRVTKRYRNGVSRWESVRKVVERGEEPAWIPARELTRDHIMLYPVLQGEEDLAYAPFEGGRPIPLNNDFLTLAACYVAEGSCNGRNHIPYQVHFSFNAAADRLLATRLQEVLTGYGLHPFTRVSRDRSLDVIASSSSLGMMLTELFGRGAAEKRLPRWMLLLPREKQRLLLATLWQCDGYVGRAGGYWRAHYTTISHRLAREVHQLLLRLGVPAYLVQQAQRDRRKGWMVVVTGKPALSRLFHILGRESPEELRGGEREKMHVALDERFLYLPVFRLRKVPYEGPIHNIEVVEDHAYSVSLATQRNCEVNGPGEAKDADVGIAAGAGRAIIFRKGQKARVVQASEMLTALMDEVQKAEAEVGA